MGSSSELWARSAEELVSGYATGAFSPVEVVDDVAQRIDIHSPSLGAFTTLCLERAGDEARAAERLLRRGRAAGALTGVPLAVKDVFDTAGVRTTYGSRIFEYHVPDRDAAAVAAVRAAGGIIVGKTQTHEFAWGLTSVNEAMGTARNPWSPELVAGGSSGGSAVALAARFVPLALGSDTGGSTRVPAAFCGVLGFKPSYGRVDRAGLWPLAPSLDHPGAMSRTPADLQRLFAVLDGAPPPAMRHAHDLEGTRIVVCPELHLTPLSDDTERSLRAAIETLTELGAKVVERRLPSAARIVDAFSAIQAAEAVEVHRAAGLFPARRDEYGRDVRGRLEWGTALEQRRYLAAIATREQVRAEFGRLLADGALLVTPVSAGPPVTIATELRGGQDFRAQVLPYTSPHDLVGLPSCAVRCGFDTGGLPIGIQLCAAQWCDWEVLAAVRAFWEATAKTQAVWPAALTQPPT